MRHQERHRNLYQGTYLAELARKSTKLTPMALVSSAAQEAITWVKFSGMSSLKEEAGWNKAGTDGLAKGMRMFLKKRGGKNAWCGVCTPRKESAPCY